MRFGMAELTDDAASPPHRRGNGGGVHAPTGGELIDSLGIDRQRFAQGKTRFTAVRQAEHLQFFFRGRQRPLVPQSSACPGVSAESAGARKKKNLSVL